MEPAARRVLAGRGATGWVGRCRGSFPLVRGWFLPSRSPTDHLFLHPTHARSDHRTTTNPRAMVTQPLHLQRDMTHDALGRSTAATPSTHIEACMTIHTHWCVRRRLIAAAPLSLLVVILGWHPTVSTR